MREKEETVTGTLENWSDSHMYSKSLQGNVYGDVHGRFRDGEFIHTSTVIGVRDGIAYTKNSRYKLGKERVYTPEKTVTDEEMKEALEILQNAII